MTSAAQAEAVARYVISAGRTRPVVVLTASPGGVESQFDVGEIGAALGPEVDVRLLAAPDAVAAFGALMPAGGQTYGGAARVYPPGRAWLDDPARLPLRFPGGQADGAAGVTASSLLVDDALAMVARANWRSGRVPAGRRRVDGVVKGLVANRAVVRLEDGTFAAVTPALTVPGLPVHRLCAVGQQVVGLHDPATSWLDVHDSLRAPSQLLKPYKVGRVVLVEVGEVADDHLVVRLHPDVEVRVERVDAAPEGGMLPGLYSAGDVVRAVVTARPPAWALRLVDVPDGTAVKAVALLAGGPPWLAEVIGESRVEQSAAPVPPTVRAVPGPPVGRRSSTAPVDVGVADPGTGEPVSSAVRATPGMVSGRRRTQLSATPVDMSAPRVVPAPLPPAVPAPSVSVPPVRKAPVPVPPVRKQPGGSGGRDDVVRLPAAGLRGPVALGDDVSDVRPAEVRALLGEFVLLERDRERLEARIASLTEQLRDQRAQLRGALASQSRGASVRPAFADAEAGLRHEITGAWARRIPVAEQPSLPLGDFLVGPEFVDSLTRLGEGHRDKALAVAVEVILGLAPSLPGREVHRYRESESGGSPYVTRADGAALWRANLQSGSAAARRMHYWILPGGTVELCHVGVHDERPPH